MHQRTDHAVCRLCTALADPGDATGRCARCVAYADLDHLTEGWPLDKVRALVDTVVFLLQTSTPEDAARLWPAVQAVIEADH